MMSKRFLILGGLCSVLTLTVSAQGALDALRYSLFDYSSTARAVGSGSALGALGADFSVLSTNPAGLGWYRRSEFVFTPGISSTNVQSQLTNDNRGGFSEDGRGAFNISSFGMVIAGAPGGSDWSGVNFGIGLNRLADLNQQFYWSGASRGSITDSWLETANTFNTLDPFTDELAVTAGAIYDTDNDTFYESDFQLEPDALVEKNQTVTSRGSISELALSLAGNYKERILIGATVGLPFVTYSENKLYREVDNGAGQDGDIPFFDDLEYEERYTTTGIGVNFKLGILVRPIQALRLGAAVHSPTAYKLEDNYSNSLIYNYTESGQAETGEADSDDGLFEYRLRSPWRYIGNAGIIIGKFGFLSGEIEMVDYGNAKFRYDGFAEDERAANDSIVSTLSSAMNIRLGGEIAYEVFRFRGGFGLHHSPFAGDDTINNSFSAGLGIRGESIFVDFAYRRYNFKETFIPYLVSEAPQQFVNNDINTNQFLLTLGFKF